MADTLRLAVLKALTAHLETVSVAAGAHYNLAGNVFRSRAAFGKETPRPFVTIREFVEADRFPSLAGGHDDSMARDRWILLMQGFVDDDEGEKHVGDNAHRLLGDVKKKLGELVDDDSDQYMLGGLISDCEYEAGVVRAPDDLAEVPCFYLRVTLGVCEKRGDPFAVN